LVRALASSGFADPPPRVGGGQPGAGPRCWPAATGRRCWTALSDLRGCLEQLEGLGGFNKPLGRSLRPHWRPCQRCGLLLKPLNWRSGSQGPSCDQASARLRPPAPAVAAGPSAAREGSRLRCPRPGGCRRRTARARQRVPAGQPKGRKRDGRWPRPRDEAKGLPVQWQSARGASFACGGSAPAQPEGVWAQPAWISASASCLRWPDRWLRHHRTGPGGVNTTGNHGLASPPARGPNPPHG